MLKSEAAQAITMVKETIARYNLTATDLGLSLARGKTQAKASGVQGKASQPKPVAVAKYRDPNTGRTWTGHGKQPGWYKSARNKDALRIMSATADRSLAPEPAMAPPPESELAVPAKKAAGKSNAALTSAQKKVAGKTGAAALPAKKATKAAKSVKSGAVATTEQLQAA